MKYCLHLFLLLLFWYAHGAMLKAQQKTNVIFIYADDLGYGDLSCYGSDSIDTPHLDALAKNGVRFTNFYATSPICSPSRAGAFNRTISHSKWHRACFFPHSKGGLDTTTFTMAEMFKDQGYATGVIGKWHLGHQPHHHPSRHGFDYFFGLRYSNDMDWERPWKPNYKPKQPLALYRDTTIIDQPVHQPTLTQRYTAEAINFIARHQDEPFFLYFPHTFPHEPLFASAEFKGTSKYGLYGDVVQELDHSVGEVLKALKEFGLSENTLVVFSSDNGARQVPQRWGNKEACGSNGILRGRKQTTFEGGIRVPTIAYGKRFFEGGKEDSRPAIMTDWLPTFAALTNYALPNDRTLNGTNLLTLPESEERDFFFYRMDKLNAVRSGKWKLKLANPNKIRGEPLPHDTDLLFDLESDPGEKNNMATQYPKIVKRLKKKIATFQKSIAPLPEMQK